MMMEVRSQEAPPDRSLSLIHVEFVGNDLVWSCFGHAMVVVFVGARKVMWWPYAKSISKNNSKVKKYQNK
jgi:hypothetical protein